MSEQMKIVHVSNLALQLQILNLIIQKIALIIKSDDNIDKSTVASREGGVCSNFRKY